MPITLTSVPRGGVWASVIVIPGTLLMLLRRGSRVSRWGAHARCLETLEKRQEKQSETALKAARDLSERRKRALAPFTFVMNAKHESIPAAVQYVADTTTVEQWREAKAAHDAEEEPK